MMNIDRKGMGKFIKKQMLNLALIKSISFSKHNSNMDLNWQSQISHCLKRLLLKLTNIPHDLYSIINQTFKKKKRIS